MGNLIFFFFLLYERKIVHIYIYIYIHLNNLYRGRGMGSPESGAGAVDCCIGSIVWVRRRNGSWWPGKILGPDELSASHVMSPRSGTPVKLLGREDASV